MSDVTTTYHERMRNEVEALRAEVRDLKARLRAVRRACVRDEPWMDTVPRVMRFTDLRNKSWRKARGEPR